jgi:hypothetical protein
MALSNSEAIIAQRHFSILILFFTAKAQKSHENRFKRIYEIKNEIKGNF